MRARRVWVAGMVLALVVPAGCSDEPAAPQWADAAPSEPPGQEAAPLSDAEKAFLTALEGIDEKAAAEADAVDNGRDTCRDIELDKTNAQIVKNASVRFKSTGATAREIVKAARTSICKATP